MMRSFKSGWARSPAAVDARALVPVSDEIGGVVMYLNGQLTYYVLNGEWFEALPELGVPEAKAHAGFPAADFSVI